MSQVLCSSPVLPPGGCLQYHTGLAGQVRSFNFLASTYNHLADQYYKVSLQWEVGWLVTCSTAGVHQAGAGLLQHRLEPQHRPGLLQDQPPRHQLQLGGGGGHLRHGLRAHTRWLEINRYISTISMLSL